MACSWGYGYSPWAVEFYFFNFIFVINIFIWIKQHYRRFCQLISAKCRLDGMACGSVKTVSKSGNRRFLLRWQISSFLQSENFLSVKECNVGFFSNWNTSAIAFFVLKYIKEVVSATLFRLVDFVYEKRFSCLTIAEWNNKVLGQ